MTSERKIQMTNMYHGDSSMLAEKERENVYAIAS